MTTVKAKVSKNKITDTSLKDYEKAIEDLSNFALGINQEVSNISLGMAIDALTEKAAQLYNKKKIVIVNQ